MCGITGIWSRENDRDEIRAEVSDAVRRLRHRGPDDEGVWSNGTGVALGHTRLSILDLSATGHQPMVSADKSKVLVFNGEIYNFQEIRVELQRIGHSFLGSGDTEVILHAFQEWGTDAVSRFVGMFAIAYWDETEKSLQLIRDRLGVKPLYYGWNGRTLCFGSELKAIRAFSHWSPQVNLQSLGEFLQYGYVSGERTIYESVHKLKPGHKLILKNGHQPVIEPYWSINDALAEPQAEPDSVIETRLEELLIESMRARMISDVPVGVYLSGGVDSSLVTAMLAKHHSQPIRTFTIGFGNSEHDESAWARKVADHCGSIHSEFTLAPEEALKIAADWGSLFDEPFGDSSGIPTLLVSRCAKDHVKVVLSADGGDELFSGYQVYSYVLKRIGQLDRIPGFLRNLLCEILTPFTNASARNEYSEINAAHGGESQFAHKLERLVTLLRDPTAGHLFDRSVSFWRPDEIAHLLGRYASPRRNANCYPGEPATQLSLWDIQHYLPEDILTKVDRTTMAVSIEGREPLLDHRLAEFALALPPHLRRGSLGPKHMLKKILYKYVPRELVDRPKKGFSIPLGQWLATDLKDLVDLYLDEGRVRDAGLMDAELVRRTVSDFYRGNSALSTRLWYLLAFEMWREAWG